MEIAWKRQMQLEADIAAELSRGPDGVVWDVRDLAHLEKIHKVAEGRVVVMLAYSRSCGSCKRAIDFLQQMSRQVRAETNATMLAFKDKPIAPVCLECQDICCSAECILQGKNNTLQA